MAATYIVNFSQNIQSICNGAIKIIDSENPKQTLRELLADHNFGGNPFEFTYSNPELYPGLELFTKSMVELAEKYSGKKRNSDFGLIALNRFSLIEKPEIAEQILDEMVEVFKNNIEKQQFKSVSEKFAEIETKLQYSVDIIAANNKNRLKKQKIQRLPLPDQFRIAEKGKRELSADKKQNNKPATPANFKMKRIGFPSALTTLGIAAVAFGMGFILTGSMIYTAIAAASSYLAIKKYQEQKIKDDQNELGSKKV